MFEMLLCLTNQGLVKQLVKPTIKVAFAAHKKMYTEIIMDFCLYLCFCNTERPDFKACGWLCWIINSNFKISTSAVQVRNWLSGSRKYPYPQQGCRKFCWGGSFKNKKIIYYKGKYEAKLECPGEWQRGFKSNPLLIMSLGLVPKRLVGGQMQRDERRYPWQPWKWEPLHAFGQSEKR